MDAHERQVPPAGGFGGGPVSKDFGLVDSSPPRQPLTAYVTVAIMLLVLGSVLVLLIVGCRRYIAVAKTAEARHSLSLITADAAAVFEERHRMCPSASRPVPLDVSAISGRPYQTSAHEWQVDAPTDAGFACIRYEMPQPQYFQYSYFATPTSFLARARGDLNGDGVLSDFMWTGDVRDDHAVIAPHIYERDVNE